MVIIRIALISFTCTSRIITPHTRYRFVSAAWCTTLIKQEHPVKVSLALIIANELYSETDLNLWDITGNFVNQIWKNNYIEIHYRFAEE